MSECVLLASLILCSVYCELNSRYYEQHKDFVLAIIYWAIGGVLGWSAVGLSIYCIWEAM